MQVDIYDALLTQFPNMTGYGRVYRNESERGVIPEAFVEDTNDYKEVFLDSSLDLSFGFIDNETHTSEDGVVYIAKIKVFFWVNISILSATERQDAEMHRIVSVILKENGYPSDNETELEKGVDNVFKGFNVENLKSSDIHPFHLFSFNFNLPYNLTKKCQ